MKTILSSQPPPPLYTIINHSPWNPKIPTFNHHPTPKWKLHSTNANDFSRPPPIKETLDVKKSEKNGDNNDDDDEIPQEVFERMIVRILVSVGVPLGIGLGMLSVFGVIKEQNLWDVPKWLPVLTTFLTFGSSTLGIAYGALSTSLDAEKKGSVFGFDEVKENWVEMWKEENKY